MRKHFVAGLAGVSAVALAIAAGPAAADVTVVATLDKFKDIDIVETVLKDKAIFIHVAPMLTPDGAAEAEAVVNAENIAILNTPPSEGQALNNDFDATIDGSILQNSGITGVNQDVGNYVNQGNVVAFGLTDSATAAADAQAWTEQDNANNALIQVEEDTFVDDQPGKPPVEVVDEGRTATINASINENTGITGVNQNAGDANNQHNSVSLTVGLGSIAALSESALGQDNAGNSLLEVNTARFNALTDSVNANSGITAVNQTTGNFNNQASVVSFSATISTVSVGTPQI